GGVVLLIDTEAGKSGEAGETLRAGMSGGRRAREVPGRFLEITFSAKADRARQTEQDFCVGVALRRRGPPALENAVGGHRFSLGANLLALPAQQLGNVRLEAFEKWGLQPDAWREADDLAPSRRLQQTHGRVATD